MLLLVILLVVLFGVCGGSGNIAGAGHGGPIVAVLGAVSSMSYVFWQSVLLFFLAIIVGSIVTFLIYGGLLIIQALNIKIFKLMN